MPADTKQSATSRNANKKQFGIRYRLARKLVAWLLGEASAAALDEGLFRNSGEVHRWMYDRFSLREVCLELGFSDFQILTATQSQIPNFGRYRLDECDGAIRKPDSLYVECRRPVDR